MTPHDHTTLVPGCFRCELGRDEAMDATLDHELVERAHHAYRDEYRKNFPAGGDAGDDAEACRCGVEAVLLLALNHRAARVAPKREREPLRWREGEPSDDEIYNGYGMEGGVAYDPSPTSGQEDAAA